MSGLVLEPGAGDPARELRALREASQLLAAEGHPAALVELILDKGIELVRAERGFVILAGGGGGSLQVAAARNLDRETIERPEFRVSRSIVQRVLSNGVPLLINDAGEERDTREIPSVKALQLRSVLCVPLRARGALLGVVYVDHRHVRAEFGPADLAALEAFAAPAGAILEGARLVHELRRGQEELTLRLETIERLRAELSDRYRARARELNRLREPRPLEPPGAEVGLPGIVSRAPAMLRLAALARKVAQSDAPVLILGESGTGKELLARALHALSPRRAGPFLGENVAALADTLLESELFGHERGAFTGATEARPGLFEAARGGTVFLDEVGEMSPAVQAKLLRVLQEREVRRLGSQSLTPVDVRLLAATHRDLEGMVAAGTFRADLYYRLNVVRLELPPLRERREDVVALLDHFSAQHGLVIEPQAREVLLAHDWPGNVRELENEVRRLAIVCAGEPVRPGQLSPTLLQRRFLASGPGEASGEDDLPLEGVWRLDELERLMILRALRRAQGNKTLAAKLLGIPKSSLYDRLDRHGIREQATRR